MASDRAEAAVDLPRTCLPTWDIGELPKPKPLGWHRLAGLIGPGIVMCGIQIGGGEWLFGPAITAKYGGGLMWIATVAIVLQMFYNLECGRYALYCGEPIFTGVMRTRPGPRLWVSLTMLLSIGALIPGLSTNAAVLIASLSLDRPPTADDAFRVNTIAYICLAVVVLPVLVGGKVYNMLQVVMTAKVVIVLSFCLILGLFLVSFQGWFDVFSGFLRFGNVPVDDGQGGEAVANVFVHYYQQGEWPLIALTNIAVVGAFAGYAGGGGLSNSAYSSFVRDKGWGMGGQVGAIASAVGGRNIKLSHIGSVFVLTTENLSRWKSWWKYILYDQMLIWVPGCFMGMALPALLSIQFAQHSPMFGVEGVEYAQTLIVADGIRHAYGVGTAASQALWIVTLLVGLMVFLPSQMAIVDDFSRRWTDIIWSANRRVRDRMQPHQAKYVFYTILGLYVGWSFFSATIFLQVGDLKQYGDAPRLMVLCIANLNNVALGATAFHILWVNLRLLPKPLRPGWLNCIGMVLCGVFYLGLATLVFLQLPFVRNFFGE